MTTELDAAVAWLREKAEWPGNGEHARLVLAELERRKARDWFQESLEDPEARKAFAEEWLCEEKVTLQEERDAARAEVERLRAELNGESITSEVNPKGMAARYEALSQELARLRERDAQVREALVDLIAVTPDMNPEATRHDFDHHSDFVEHQAVLASKRAAEAALALLKETP